MPFNLFKHLYTMSTQNTSFGFSSVPGPSDGWLFHGAKTKGMYAFYPSVCEQLCTSLAVNMDETIKVCFVLDHNYIEKPDLFIEMFKKRINEFMSTKIVEAEKSAETTTE